MNYKLLVILFFTQFIVGQTINGHFPEVKNSEIVLKIYEGFTEKQISQTRTDNEGNFVIDFPKEYKGAAILQIKGVSNLIVLLNQENFIIYWDDLQRFDTLLFKNSRENDAFTMGMQIHQKSNQKFAGLKYLLPLYNDESDKLKWLTNEIKIQEQTFDDFIKKLPESSYVKDYLFYRNLLESMQLTHENYKEINRVAKHEREFSKINFSSDALWHSGLLKELINSFYQLLELYTDEKIINEYIIEANNGWLKALEKHPSRQQEVAQFCFNLLESRNHVKASEFIALTMLNQSTCQLTEQQIDLFEQYRKLAIGSKAPEIIFISSHTKSHECMQLSTIDKSYKLIVFGASWCPNCQTDYPSLVGKYKLLKEKHNLELIYISIDTDINAFENYYKDAPFITYCDTKGWETQAAKDYHIYATPNYILLDKNLKIVAKFKSPEQIEEWFFARM